MTEQQNELQRRKRRSFTQVDNEIANNEQISWQAKGMMLYLLSKPDGWVFYETDLIKRATNGRDSVRAIIKELLDYGYLKRGERIRNEKGHLGGYKYTVEDYLYESYDGKSYIGKPYVGKTKVGKPYVGKTDTSNTEGFSNTYSSSNTESSSSNTEEQAPEKDYNDDEQVLNPFIVYEQEIGSISPIVAHKLDAEIEEMGEELVCEAISMAALYNKRSLGYVQTVLKNWYHLNLKTLADVQAHERGRNRNEKHQRSNEPAKQYDDGVNF